MVDRRDKYVSLEHRVFRALMETCDAETCAGCFPCGRRYEAVMRAFSYERDLIARHDAIVDTVVRDRIIESKKAERYRLAWLSAKQGRRSWKGLYLGTIDPRRHDPLGLRFLDLARKHAREIRRLKQALGDSAECSLCEHAQKWHIWDHVIQRNFCAQCPGAKDLHSFE